MIDGSLDTQLANYTPEQQRCITAFQRTYGSVRITQLKSGKICLDGFSRRRPGGRRRLLHRIVVTP